MRNLRQELEGILYSIKQNKINQKYIIINNQHIPWLSSMRTVLKLFNKTFTRIPKIQQKTPLLSKNLHKITDIYTLDQRARLIYLNKLIMTEVSDLQQETPVEVINRFSGFYDEFSYDYEQKQFVMRKYAEKSDVELRLKTVFIQRFDHPFFRDSLYFHEMKDAHKYYQISVPEQFPKYLRDELKKYQVDKLLDKKNPLGVPLQSQPLKLSVKLSNFESSCIFNIQSKLGKTLIKSCVHITDQNTRPLKLNPLNFDRDLQQTMYLLLKEKAGVTPNEIQEMNKLMFVGGCVEKIQLMMDIFQEIGAEQMDEEQSGQKEDIKLIKDRQDQL